METRVLSDVNIGNLEMGQTQGGTTKAKLSVADNHTDRDGNETTAWHNVRAYGSTAEFLQRNAQKGRRVSLSGTVEYWEHEGDQYSTIELDSIRFVDSRDENAEGFDNSGGGGQNSYNGGQSQQSQQGGDYQGGNDGDNFEPDDELPF